MPINLFGEEQEYPVDDKRSPYQRCKALYRYREAENKEESCRTCSHRIDRQYDKYYYKCELIGDSMSAATDIRLKNTCDRWEK